MLPFSTLASCVLCPQKYATFSSALPLAASHAAAFVLRAKVCYAFCAAFGRLYLRVARKSMLHFIACFQLTRSLCVCVCVLCPQMYATLFVHLIWKQISSSVRDDYSFPLTPPRCSATTPCPLLNAINLTVFALYSALPCAASTSRAAFELMLNIFYWLHLRLHSVPPQLPAPPAHASCPFWLRVFAQVYEISVLPPNEKSNRSDCGCSWTRRELRPHLVELHFCGCYVRVCTCVCRCVCVCGVPWVI